MSEAHWYVVHTYSGYENKVKVDIEKTIENRNLQDQILEVSVPMLPVVELKNGVEKKADKKTPTTGKNLSFLKKEDSSHKSLRRTMESNGVTYSTTMIRGV